MEIIRLIINSLNQIEVKGDVNLDRLLGCIQGLERLDKVMDEVHNNGDQDEPKQDVSSTVD